MTPVYDFIINMFLNIIDMIVAHPLISLPIIMAILAGIVTFCVKMVRRIGAKGIGGGRGRRRR